MSDFQSNPTADSGGTLPTGSPSPADSSFQGGQAPGTAAAAPEPTFDVTINGKVEKVPLSELQKGYSRTQDYTQKTQRLAAERQQIQAQVQEYEGALREVQSFLQDPQRVYAYAKSMGATHQEASQAAANAGNADPMQLLTRSEAQELINQQLQQAAPNLLGASQQQIQQLRLELATREYKNVFDQKIAQLQDQHPELKRLGPRGAQMLRMEAMNQQPQTVDAAIEALELAAQALAGDFTNVLKQEAVAGNPLRNGIEPPGGAGILPAPQAPFKKLTDPRLRELVMQDLMNGVSSRGNG